MPSTHSQIMAFAWANMVLQVRTGMWCPPQTDRTEGIPAVDSVFSVAASVTWRLQMRAGRHPRHPGVSTLDALEFVVLTSCVAAVAWSRIYLGYHDGSQVCAGAAPEDLALLSTCWRGWNLIRSAGMIQVWQPASQPLSCGGGPRTEAGSVERCSVPSSTSLAQNTNTPSRPPRVASDQSAVARVFVLPIRDAAAIQWPCPSVGRTRRV